MRQLTKKYRRYCQEDVLYPILLMQAKFDGGDLNLWTGYGPLEWNGDTFIGSGQVLKIDRIEEKSAVEAVRMQVSIEGLSTSMKSIAIGEDYQGREFTMWLGLLVPYSPDLITQDGDSIVNQSGNNFFINDQNFGELVRDPYPFFHGKMDVMNIDEDAESGGENDSGYVNIGVSVESALIDMNKSPDSYYTPEEQKTVFPDDRGFEFVAWLQDAEIIFGRR
jgi:hypothetical protein